MGCCAVEEEDEELRDLVKGRVNWTGSVLRDGCRYILNQHPLLSICFKHPRHPVKACARVLLLIASLGVNLGYSTAASYAQSRRLQQLGRLATEAMSAILSLCSVLISTLLSEAALCMARRRGCCFCLHFVLVACTIWMLLFSAGWLLIRQSQLGDFPLTISGAPPRYAFLDGSFEPDGIRAGQAAFRSTGTAAARVLFYYNATFDPYHSGRGRRSWLLVAPSGENADEFAISEGGVVFAYLSNNICAMRDPSPTCGTWSTYDYTADVHGRGSVPQWEEAPTLKAVEEYDRLVEITAALTIFGESTAFAWCATWFLTALPRFLLKHCKEGKQANDKQLLRKPEGGGTEMKGARAGGGAVRVMQNANV